MIARNWIGLAKKDRSEEYIQHLKTDTFQELYKIPGFISARILKRDTAEGIEFLVITEWESVGSIKQFAGENFENAVVPELVQDIMIRYDHNVRHYEVLM